MADIAMCSITTCPVRSRCYRSPDSGTAPRDGRQAWALFGPEGVGCRGYIPTATALAPRPAADTPAA